MATECLLLRCGGLLEDEGVAFILASLEVVGCCGAAKIAIEAIGVDVPFPRDVEFYFVPCVRNRNLMIKSARRRRGDKGIRDRLVGRNLSGAHRRDWGGRVNLSFASSRGGLRLFFRNVNERWGKISPNDPRLSDLGKRAFEESSESPSTR